MIKTRLALIGFMGVGKTLVSKELEKSLEMSVLSTDQIIEDQQKMSIAKIFEHKGEAFFRLLEKEVVKDVCQQDHVIIDCGGGVVLDQENVDQLRANCTVIFFSAKPETIFANIKDKTDRPLLNVDNPIEAIRMLIDARSKYYEQAAHYTIDGNNKSIGQMANEVMDIVR